MSEEKTDQLQIEYSSSNLHAFESTYESVRRRPGMFIGDVNERGLAQLVYELVANSVDQFFLGHGSFVHIELHETFFEVWDDGQGLPFNQPSSEKELSLAEYNLQHFHTTATSDQHAPHIHLIALGVGIAVVNALSSQLHIQSWREGQVWEQRYRCGEPESPPYTIPPSEARIATGTYIACTPDATIFQTIQMDEQAIDKKLHELSYLIPGLRIEWKEHVLIQPNGLQNYPTFRPDSKVYALQTIQDNVQLDIAYQLDMSSSQKPLDTQDIRIEAPEEASYIFDSTKGCSWINGVASIEGGTHIKGLQRAFADMDVRPSHVYIHVVMHDPAYAGPSKTCLETPQVEDIVYHVLTQHIQKELLSSDR